jgi:hypothetical protein
MSTVFSRNKIFLNNQSTSVIFEVRKKYRYHLWTAFLNVKLTAVQLKQSNMFSYQEVLNFYKPLASVPDPVDP